MSPSLCLLCREGWIVYLRDNDRLLTLLGGVNLIHRTVAYIAIQFFRCRFDVL